MSVTPQTPQVPPQSVPVADGPGGSALMRREWWLFLSALVRRLDTLKDAVLGWSNVRKQNRMIKVGSEGTIKEAGFADTDVVLGGPDLTTDGAIPMVSATAGTLEESALSDDGADITAADRHVVTTGARPEVRLEVTGGTRPGRVHMPVDGHVLMSSNLRYDGTDWFLDDTAHDGYMLNLNGSALYFYVASAGPNPVTPVQALEIDSTGQYFAAGTQLLAARQADPGTSATSPAVSTSAVGAGPAPAAYNATAQSMLDQSKAAIGLLNADVAALKTAVDALITDRNNLRTVLQAHGLMA